MTGQIFVIFFTLKIYTWFVLLCSLFKGSFHYVEELKESQIIKNKLLTILPVMESTYTVFFKIKQNSYSVSFKNIIHFTIGENFGRYGDRTPAVFSFNDGSGRISIASAVNGVITYGYVFYTQPLPMNEWSSIQISQFEINEIDKYAIYINGNIVHIIKNNLPKSFQNVKVYVSHPWYDATDGSIKDIRILNGKQDFVNDLNEHLFIKDNLIATLPLLESNYSVSFKLKPLSYSVGWKNVIHLTNRSNYGEYGDRIIGVWFIDDASGKVAFWSDINGVNSISSVFVSQPLPLNKWSSIRLSQSQTYRKSTFAVYLNGANVYSTENNMPTLFENVNVYVTDPWFDAPDGAIKDVRVINGNEEICGVVITAKSDNTQYKEIFVYLNVTTDCLCYLRNVYIYLQQESLLTFHKFIFDNSSLNWSVVKDNRGFFLIAVGNLDVYTYATFTAIFGYSKNITDVKTNVSIIIHSSWNNCYGDSIIKDLHQPITINIERSLQPLTSVNIMNPKWAYKQPNGTLLETQTHQFVCTLLQNRQPSPCYGREKSSGIITILPIHFMDVIGYYPATSLVYGQTFRNNMVEVDLQKKKTIVISSEKCSKIKACSSSLAV